MSLIRHNPQISSSLANGVCFVRTGVKTKMTAVLVIPGVRQKRQSAAARFQNMLIRDIHVNHDNYNTS